jgi:TolB-like protein
MIFASSSFLQAKVRNLNDGMEDLSAQIVNEMVVQNKTKIAVIEFSDLEGNRINLGKYTSEELTTKLFQSRKFNVIERSMMEKVYKEQQLSISGIIDEKSARQLGKILGVDAICSGTITDLGKTVKINARLISTETGSLFSVASVEIEKDDKVDTLMATAGEKKKPVVQQKGETLPAAKVLDGRVAAELDKGLVLHFPFNGNARDLSGNNNHGEVHGARLTMDRFNNPDSAYYFSGASSHISVKKGPHLKMTDLSISIWFKSSSNANDIRVLIADEKQYTSQVIWSYRLFGDKNTGNLFFDFTLNNRTDSARISSGINIHDDSWHHAVVTRQMKNNELRLYYDGDFINSSTFTGSVDNSPNPVYIGLSPYLGASYPFRGIIDDVRIYNRALGLDEVKALYKLQN